MTAAAVAVEAPLTPCGYKILVRVRTASSHYDSGLWKTQTERDVEQAASMVGEVCDVGADAYQDSRKFPNGPWCKTGDWILFKAYAGTRIPLEDKEIHYRLLNDDAVEAVLRRPQEVK